MKEYLEFSPDAVCLQAGHSGHYIHLTEPELIVGAAEEMLSPSDAAGNRPRRQGEIH